MTHLLRAELLRLRSRKLFHLFGVLIVGLLILIAVLVFQHYGKPGQSLEYAVGLRNGMRIAADILFSLSVVVGASFVGAEWTSGGMSSVLVWEPRRERVFGMKMASAAIGLFGAVLAVLALVALVLVPTAAAHGSFGGMTGEWWRSTLGIWLRAGALASMGAAIGVGLAYLLRSAAGSIATWLIFEFVASQALTLWKPGWFRWLPSGNVQLFIGPFGRGEFNGASLFPSSLSALRGGIVLGCYATGLLLAGFASFRARDVT